MAWHHLRLNAVNQQLIQGSDLPPVLVLVEVASHGGLSDLQARGLKPFMGSLATHFRCSEAC